MPPPRSAAPSPPPPRPLPNAAKAVAFSYSYEPGTFTTTVYYHNRCGVTRKLTIYRQSNSPCNDDKIELYVDGGAKGDEVVRCGDVTEVVGE